MKLMDQLAFLGGELWRRNSFTIPSPKNCHISGRNCSSNNTDNNNAKASKGNCIKNAEEPPRKMRSPSSSKESVPNKNDGEAKAINELVANKDSAEEVVLMVVPNKVTNNGPGKCYRSWN